MKRKTARAAATRPEVYPPADERPEVEALRRGEAGKVLAGLVDKLLVVPIPDYRLMKRRSAKKEWSRGVLETIDKSGVAHQVGRITLQAAVRGNCLCPAKEAQAAASCLAEAAYGSLLPDQPAAPMVVAQRPDLPETDRADAEVLDILYRQLPFRPEALVVLADPLMVREISAGNGAIGMFAEHVATPAPPDGSSFLLSGWHRGHTRWTAL